MKQTRRELAACRFESYPSATKSASRGLVSEANWQEVDTPERRGNIGLIARFANSWAPGVVSGAFKIESMDIPTSPKIAEAYQPLFDLMRKEHGLLLLPSELDEVIRTSVRVLKSLDAIYAQETSG